MNNCPNCGARLPEAATACPVCGYVLQQKIPRGDLTKKEPQKAAENATLAASEVKEDALEPAATAVTQAVDPLNSEEKLGKGMTPDIDVTATAESSDNSSQSEETADLTFEADQTVTFDEPAEKSEAKSEAKPEASADFPTDFSTDRQAQAQGQPKTFKRPGLTLLEGGQKAEDTGNTEKTAKTTSKQKPTTWEKLDLSTQVTGYFRFLNQQALEPKINPALPDSGGGKWYPLISLIILVLGNGFALSRLVTAAIYRVLGLMQSIGLQFRYVGSGVVFFLDLTLYLFVAIGLFLLAYYLVAAKVFGRPLGFLQAMGEILAPASLAVYLSVIGAVLAPFLPKASLTCVVASLLLVSVSFMGNLWQTANLSGRFNRFYTILLTILLCLLLLSLITRFFLEGMIQDLPIQQVPTGLEDLFGDGETFY
ncbi:zinc-ribbon domain-containing protein [Enterococcus asini]|uniref:zinc-ribbon domain-containing protein n=1 Tax=Enterococcus asini TaxID=57732 RepID=UPI00288D7E1B|nr:zinc-ribbon domain-containing protein [Enterococcus asini]MDT2757697.1 zinc-ribbon domain-containing protein [Enterococcus asini]